MPKVIKIGRKSENDYILDDRLAEDFHALLVIDQNGIVWIEDLNSRFGTLVNKNPISKEKLTPGDIVQIGFTALQWESLVPGPSYRPPTQTTLSSYLISLIIIFSSIMAGWLLGYLLN